MNSALGSVWDIVDVTNNYIKLYNKHFVTTWHGLCVYATAAATKHLCYRLFRF